MDKQQQQEGERARERRRTTSREGTGERGEGMEEGGEKAAAAAAMIQDIEREMVNTCEAGMCLSRMCNMGFGNN